MRNLLKFKTGDLVIIGLFTGVAKASSLIVALMGGGMNPVTLLLKNAIYSSLILIMLIKVKRPGTLTISVILSSILSILLFGRLMLFFPAALVCCVIAEVFMAALEKVLPSVWAYFTGIALYELLSVGLSLVFAFLSTREDPVLIIPVMIILSIGYMGVLIGLIGGNKMIKELRHAGLIQN